MHKSERAANNIQLINNVLTIQITTVSSVLELALGTEVYAAYLNPCAREITSLIFNSFEWSLSTGLLVCLICSTVLRLGTSHTSFLSVFSTFCAQVIYSDDEKKFNSEIIFALIRSDLLDVREYNVHLAKLIDGGRNSTLNCFVL